MLEIKRESRMTKLRWVFVFEKSSPESQSSTDGLLQTSPQIAIAKICLLLLLHIYVTRFWNKLNVTIRKRES